MWILSGISEENVFKLYSKNHTDQMWNVFGIINLQFKQSKQEKKNALQPPPPPTIATNSMELRRKWVENKTELVHRAAMKKSE